MPGSKQELAIQLIRRTELLPQACLGREVGTPRETHVRLNGCGRQLRLDVLI
jgi:hypothetical protein